jgi:hypothetical protein
VTLPESLELNCTVPEVVSSPQDGNNSQAIV